MKRRKLLAAIAGIACATRAAADAWSESASKLYRHEHGFNQDLMALGDRDFLDRVALSLDVCETEVDTPSVAYRAWYKTRVAQLKGPGAKRLAKFGSGGDKDTAKEALSLARRVTALPSSLATVVSSRPGRIEGGYTTFSLPVMRKTLD